MRFALADPPTPLAKKQKPTLKVGLCFWWEWVDSNHLSRKTTDLQSAPALQLRRTPREWCEQRESERIRTQ